MCERLFRWCVLKMVRVILVQRMRGGLPAIADACSRTVKPSRRTSEPDAHFVILNSAKHIDLSVHACGRRQNSLANTIGHWLAYTLQDIGQMIPQNQRRSLEYPQQKHVRRSSRLDDGAAVPSGKTGCHRGRIEIRRQEEVRRPSPSVVGQPRSVHWRWRIMTITCPIPYI